MIRRKKLQKTLIMLDNKFLKHLKKKLKLANFVFDKSDLEKLIKYSLESSKKNDFINLLNDPYLLKIFNFSLRRRLSHEPISQIIGYRNFWKSVFYVDKNVLDPRPDTELIMEKVLELPSKNLSLLDLGTGSGCLAISIALERPYFQINASDICIDAIKIAKFNAMKHNTRINFIKSDWFDNIIGDFDVIICNPPYVSKNEYMKLSLGVRRFEPKIALYGGLKGLDCYRKIINDIFCYLKPNGLVFFEIGYNQEKDICKLFQDYGYDKIEFFKDLTGKYRTVCVKKDAI